MKRLAGNQQRGEMHEAFDKHGLGKADEACPSLKRIISQ